MFGAEWDVKETGSTVVHLAGLQKGNLDTLVNILSEALSRA